MYKLPASGAAPDQLTGGQQVKFEEPAYELGPGEQGDFDSNILRLTYTSLTTPATVLDHNMATGNRCCARLLLTDCCQMAAVHLLNLCGHLLTG